MKRWRVIEEEFARNGHEPRRERPKEPPPPPGDLRDDQQRGEEAEKLRNEIRKVTEGIEKMREQIEQAHHRLQKMHQRLAELEGRPGPRGDRDFQPRRPGGDRPPFAGGPPPERAMDLERRLEAIMRDVEELRREIRMQQFGDRQSAGPIGADRRPEGPPPQGDRRPRRGDRRPDAPPPEGDRGPGADRQPDGPPPDGARRPPPPPGGDRKAKDKDRPPKDNE